MSPKCLPPSFNTIQLIFRKQLTFQDFQTGHHGGHLGYWNKTNLAILNLHVTPMPPTMFGLNPTYSLIADVVWRFSKWPSWRPSWILECNIYSNSESLCCSDVSHQVSAQSDLLCGSNYCLKIIVWPTWCPPWILEQNDFSNSNTPCGPNTSHQVWAQSDLG